MKQQLEVEKPPHRQHKLTPQYLELAIELISEEYREGEPIYYSSDLKLHRDILGISRFTVSDILELARLEEVIPIPYTLSRERHGYVYHPREEIIEAFEYVSTKSQQEGFNLFRYMKQLRYEEKNNPQPKLTISQAASKISVPYKQFRAWIIEGEIETTPVVQKSAERVKNPSHHNIIPPNLLEHQSLKKLIEQYIVAERQSQLSIRLRNREFFTPVSKLVLNSCGIYPDNRKVSGISQLLEERGVKVHSYNNPSNKREGTYRMIAKEDEEEVAKILKELQRSGKIKPPVEQISGEKVPTLPSTLQLHNRERYLRIRPLLRKKRPESYPTDQDIKYFGEQTGITIFRDQKGYYSPNEEMPLIENAFGVA